jgi:hypothetical protein
MCKTAWTVAQTVTGTTPSPTPTDLSLFETPLFPLMLVFRLPIPVILLVYGVDSFRTPYNGRVRYGTYMLVSPRLLLLRPLRRGFGGADDPPPSML